MQAGDEVRWGDVPAGALVFSDPGTGLRWWYFREGKTGNVVGIGSGSRVTFWACSAGHTRPAWDAWSPPDKMVRVVALGLTGNETADDIRRLAGL